MDTQSPESPDFESVKQISPYDAEYWSARDLAPLLGYTKWQNFEVAVKRAKTACEQVSQVTDDHFTGASKMITLGSGLGSDSQRFVHAKPHSHYLALSRLHITGIDGTANQSLLRPKFGHTSAQHHKLIERSGLQVAHV